MKTKRVKRLLGMKVPKSVGEFVATPEGKMTVVGVAVAAGLAAASDERVRRAIVAFVEDMKNAAAKAGEDLRGAARSAVAPMKAALQPIGEASTSGTGVRRTPQRQSGNSALHS